MIAVETHGLTKRYGDRLVVDALDLRVTSGSVTGFVGPNGAGKTTTIRMLLGLVRPDAGTGTLLGRPLADPRASLRRVGAMIEGPAFYPTLSGRANLAVLARLGGLRERRVDEVLGIVGLSDHAGVRFSSYSLGMRQRLGVAAALLPDPELLILDEPTNGLDPAGIREVRSLLRRLADGGTTVLVSSHLLAEIEVICDELVLIAGGRLQFQGRVRELLERRRPTLRARPEDPADLAALKLLAEAAGHPASLAGPDVLVDAPAPWAGELNRRAMQGGITLVALAIEQPGLEEAFFAMTEAPGEVAA